ncbi:MAG: hypothetical protein KGY99_07950 [Phycisphaerae bacterium]|nr:hypothetical protein [Phycisphaerae bacterium]
MKPAQSIVWVLAVAMSGCQMTQRTPQDETTADVEPVAEAPKSDQPVAVMGRLVAFRDDLATVNRGSVDGLHKGQVVPIYHGALHLANLELLDVAPGWASGIVIDQRFTPKVGDVVVIPPRPDAAESP